MAFRKMPATVSFSTIMIRKVCGTGCPGQGVSPAFSGNPERQIKRIMNETRQRDNPERMIDGYIRVYEELNGGMPLA